MNLIYGRYQLIETSQLRIIKKLNTYFKHDCSSIMAKPLLFRLPFNWPPILWYYCGIKKNWINFFQNQNLYFQNQNLNVQI